MATVPARQPLPVDWQFAGPNRRIARCYFCAKRKKLGDYWCPPNEPDRIQLLTGYWLKDGVWIRPGNGPDFYRRRGRSRQRDQPQSYQRLAADSPFAQNIVGSRDVAFPVPLDADATHYVECPNCRTVQRVARPGELG